MIVYEQLLEVLRGQEGEIFSTKEIKDLVQQRFGRKRGSVMPSDFCYNRLNKGIPFNRHLYEQIGPGEYRYLGENHRYTGPIAWQPEGEIREQIVGEWRDGQLTRYDPPSGLS